MLPAHVVRPLLVLLVQRAWEAQFHEGVEVRKHTDDVLKASDFSSARADQKTIRSQLTFQSNLLSLTGLNAIPPSA